MYDLFLSEWVDENRLVAALAHVFAVPPQQIHWDPDLSGVARAGTLLRCSYLRRGGEFPMAVSVYPQEPTARPWPSESAVAQAVSARLRLRILISDGTANPFRWRLVEAASVRPVFVETDALDRDELVIDPARRPQAAERP